MSLLEYIRAEEEERSTAMRWNSGMVQSGQRLPRMNPFVPCCGKGHRTHSSTPGQILSVLTDQLCNCWSFGLAFPMLFQLNPLIAGGLQRIWSCARLGWVFPCLQWIVLSRISQNLLSLSKSAPNSRSWNDDIKPFFWKVNLPSPPQFFIQQKY